jgi:hypothetical protein
VKRPNPTKQSFLERYVDVVFSRTACDEETSAVILVRIPRSLSQSDVSKRILAAFETFPAMDVEGVGIGVETSVIGPTSVDSEQVVLRVVAKDPSVLATPELRESFLDKALEKVFGHGLENFYPFPSCVTALMERFPTHENTLSGEIDAGTEEALRKRKEIQNKLSAELEKKLEELRGKYRAELDPKKREAITAEALQIKARLGDGLPEEARKLFLEQESRRLSGERYRNRIATWLFAALVFGVAYPSMLRARETFEETDLAARSFILELLSGTPEAERRIETFGEAEVGGVTVFGTLPFPLRGVTPSVTLVGEKSGGVARCELALPWSVFRNAHPVAQLLTECLTDAVGVPGIALFGGQVTSDLKPRRAVRGDGGESFGDPHGMDTLWTRKISIPVPAGASSAAFCGMIATTVQALFGACEARNIPERYLGELGDVGNALVGFVREQLSKSKALESEERAGFDKSEGGGEIGVVKRNRIVPYSKNAAFYLQVLPDVHERVAPVLDRIFREKAKDGLVWSGLEMMRKDGYYRGTAKVRLDKNPGMGNFADRMLFAERFAAFVTKVTGVSFHAESPSRTARLAVEWWTIPANQKNPVPLFKVRLPKFASDEVMGNVEDGKINVPPLVRALGEIEGLLRDPKRGRIAGIGRWKVDETVSTSANHFSLSLPLSPESQEGRDLVERVADALTTLVAQAAQECGLREGELPVVRIDPVKERQDRELRALRANEDSWRSVPWNREKGFAFATGLTRR